MKKLVLTVLTLTLTTTILFSQKIDIGAKAGVNYNFGGDLSELITETGNGFQDIFTTRADNKAGFHAGIWLKAKFLGLYIRPEVIYTQLNNTYNSNSINNLSTDFKTEKLDIPLLIGTKIIGPLHIYGGPSFQYILNSDFSVSEIDNVKTNDFSVGLQLGTGLELGRLGVDVRWEKGLNNDLEATFPGTNISLDNRPNQIIFGISYRFNERND